MSGRYRYRTNVSSPALWFFNRVYDRTPAVEGLTDDAIEVGSVDLEARANSGQHHTEKYELVQSGTAPVIRRGNQMNVSVSWRGRAYDQKSDRVKLIFETGDSPSVTKGTSGVAVVGTRGELNRWGAEVIGRQGNGLRLKVWVPVSAPIGQCSGRSQWSLG